MGASVVDGWDLAFLLRSARLAVGLSQRQAADVSGVNRGRISAYERGLREPTVEAFRRQLSSCGLGVALCPTVGLTDRSGSVPYGSASPSGYKSGGDP